MQSENALSIVGPRPGMEWSTVPYSGPQATASNGKQRTSSLESPIMLLTGHQSAIYTMKFNPAGTVIASGSHDKEIFLWHVHGECKNFMVLKGHKNAVLDLRWTTDGSQIISASPDKTVRAWDVESGKQIKKMAEHSSFVNSCCPSRRGPPLVVSGSDDGTAKLWDMRQRGAIQTYPDKYQITAVAFSDASDKIFTGGIDNDVKVWDLRRNEVTMTLQGHQDMITGMQLSPDGSYLLTNGMDCKLCIWDMRPYAPQNRCVKILEGHQHNFEKNLLKCSWSPDGSKVTAGSSDRMVYIWDTTSRRILYKLPGHTGSVNESVFHPICRKFDLFKLHFWNYAHSIESSKLRVRLEVDVYPPERCFSIEVAEHLSFEMVLNCARGIIWKSIRAAIYFYDVPQFQKGNTWKCNPPRTGSGSEWFNLCRRSQ
ncbi:WD40 repeat [Dillenia turbinata]|uniref:WD40 repeat n=1 Tax=Dillenia turbinata TaxID=194707 RepID=A0AAN8YVF9_9MAGN